MDTGYGKDVENPINIHNKCVNSKKVNMKRAKWPRAGILFASHFIE